MTCTTTLIRLQQDQALHIPLDAHTTLQVSAGTVVVRQPLHWLGETVLAPSVTLRPGQSCRLEQGGWVELRAQGGDAEVRSDRAAPAWQTLWQSMKHLLPQSRREAA